MKIEPNEALQLLTDVYVSAARQYRDDIDAMRKCIAEKLAALPPEMQRAARQELNAVFPVDSELPNSRKH